MKATTGHPEVKYQVVRNAGRSKSEAVSEYDVIGLGCIKTSASSPAAKTH